MTIDKPTSEDQPIPLTQTSLRRLDQILKVVETRVHGLRAQVAFWVNTPTTHRRGGGFSDKERAEARLLQDRLLEVGRQMKRLARRYERETYKTTDAIKKLSPEKLLEFATKKRLVKEYICQPSQDLTDERYRQVLDELTALPLDVVLDFSMTNRVVRPGPELDRALLMVEEKKAREEVGLAFGDKARAAKEKAFTKKFGHKP